MMRLHHRLFLTATLVVAISGLAKAATFTFTGSALSGAFTSIPIRTNSAGGNSVGTISAVAWDPTSAPSGQFPNGRIYFTNREPSVAPAQGGLYSVNASTGAVAFLGLPSSTTAGNNNLNPSSLAINPSGSVYVGRDVTPAIFRVDNPSTAFASTQMLGNYGAATTDDDPISISYVPTTNQIMIFDQGLDADLTPAISLMNASSTSASPSFTTIWSMTQTVDNNFRGAYSAVDQRGYFAYVNPVVDSGLAAVYRVSLGGTLETILLNGITTGLDVDDSIAINPIDGSLWLPTVTTGTSRTYLRVDVVNATLQSPNVYLANVTQEFTATDFNVGQNSLAWSPDGKYLAAAAPDGSDTLFIFQAIPEPTT
ncbi:MAG TPA: hypothetical protein VMZ30_14315, partial [Pyrinomonadaceae bacterium]|nr:hypothetical protein [Pyrinomonadaceae bacterium]